MGVLDGVSLGLLPVKPLAPFGGWVCMHCIRCSHGGTVRRHECSIHSASTTSEVPQNRVQLAPVHPSVEHPPGPPTHQQAPDKPAIFCSCAIVVNIVHTFPSPNDGQPMLPPIWEREDDPVELPAEPLAQPPSCPTLLNALTRLHTCLIY